MAVIKNNPIVKGASGMIGKTLVFRISRGKQQMINPPGKRASSSEKQEVVMGNFKDAINYANKMRAFPDVMKEYARGINDKLCSAFHVAHADFLNAPKVAYVKAPSYTGTPGDVITIKAKDDFKVVKVTVEIIDPLGKVLERGEAERLLRMPLIWKYKVSVANANIKGTLIKVIAFDRPGNKGLGELVL